MDTKKIFGTRGEEFAARILEDKGYQILETQYRCRAGEIDLIASKDGCYHFVEVKTRMGNAFGHPEESVTPEKQRRMVRAAMFYLTQRHAGDVRAQFDVVEIEVGIIFDCI